MKSMRICPKCGSGKIGKDLNILMLLGAPQQWKCNKCGFTSYLFPEIEMEKSKKK